MRLVILESPYRGGMTHREKNVDYARRCLADSLERGESPLASHLLYPQVLDDEDEEERQKGLEAGLAWARHAEATVVCIDEGISAGMLEGIKHAHAVERRVELRSLIVNIAQIRQRCQDCYLVYHGAVAIGPIPCPLCIGERVGPAVPVEPTP